jgi:hypothetical protein
MGQVPTGNTDTTSERGNPTLWLWIPLLGISLCVCIVFPLLLIAVDACLQGFHKDPILCGAMLAEIVGFIGWACFWLIERRKLIYPFLCDLGYSTASLVGRTIRSLSEMICGILVFCTWLTLWLCLLSLAAMIFGSPSWLAAALFIVLIALGISTYVAMIIDDKLNPANGSQPQR